VIYYNANLKAMTILGTMKLTYQYTLSIMKKIFIFSLLIFILERASNSLPDLGKLDLRGEDPDLSLLCSEFEADKHNSH
jgi:hypothetical protein